MRGTKHEALYFLKAVIKLVRGESKQKSQPGWLKKKVNFRKQYNFLNAILY